MKTVLKILLIAVCSIIMIFALAIVFLEGRLIFSLDWTVYQSPANGFIRYALRLIIALTAFGISLLEIINLKKKNAEISSIIFFAELGLLLASLPVCIFGANFIGLAYTLLAVLLFVLSALQKSLLFSKNV